MKMKFAWYLSALPANAEQAWKAGVLTVDANVLLDLYRYHSMTRDSILTTLEAFAPRVWISYQAAREFFSNRKAVIASSEKTFREATAALDDLAKSLESQTSKLRGYRLVPRPMLEDLTKTLSTAVESAREQIRASMNDHPNYLREDPILTRLLSLFDGRVGERLPRVRSSQFDSAGRATLQGEDTTRLHG
jgi:hypothetical protein